MIKSGASKANRCSLHATRTTLQLHLVAVGGSTVRMSDVGMCDVCCLMAGSVFSTQWQTVCRKADRERKGEGERAMEKEEEVGCERLN